MLGSAKLLGGLADMTVELGAGRVTMAVFQALKKAGRLAEVEKLIPAGQVIRSTDDIPVAFYSPTQPRDGQGQWSKTGGLGAGKHGAKVEGKPGWVHDANGRAVRGFGGENKVPLSDYLEQVAEGHRPPENAEAIGDEISNAFGEKTGTTAGAFVNGRGFVELYGTVEVPDGDGGTKEVGSYKRMLEPDGEGGLRVRHEFFALNNKHQGLGMGSDFLKASEDYYRDLGVTEITVEANIDVGGFAWARMGFDFQNPNVAIDFVNEASRFDDGTPGFSKDLDRALEKANKFDASGDPADAPTAFELSSLGWTPGAEKWPGKQAMLGANWEGIKYMTYPEAPTSLAATLEAIDLFYSPDQPRDGEGKFAKTGGGKAKAKAKAKQAMKHHTGPGAVSAMIKAGHLPTEKQVTELITRWANRVEDTTVRVVSSESGTPGEDGHIKEVTAHIDHMGDKMHVTFQKYHLWGKDTITTEMHVDDLAPNGTPSLAETMALGMHYHLSGDGLGEKAPKWEPVREEVRAIQDKRNLAAVQKYQRKQEEFNRQAAVEQAERQKTRKEKIEAYRAEHGPITELPKGRLQEIMELGDSGLVGEASKVVEQHVQDMVEKLPLPKGVTVGQVGINDYGRDRIDYGMQFLNEDGFGIGFARRRILHDPESNEMLVYNDHFEIGEKYQGQGFGAAFTKASDDLHRNLGIHRVEVQANIDVGGYAWARLGFTWNQDNGTYHATEIMGRAVGLALRDKLPEAPKLVEKFGKFQQSGKVADLPTPFELSRLGYKPGAKDWTGKQMLLGTNWQGVKRLDVSRETSMAEVVTMFYAPGQPRDAGGRFARTGGGGGGLGKVFRKHMGGKNLRELIHSRTLEEHGDILGGVDTSKLFVATARPLAESGMGLKLRETSPGIIQARLMDAATSRGDVIMTTGPSVHMRDGMEMRVNIAPTNYTGMADIDRLEKHAIDVAAEMGFKRETLELGSFESARQSIRDRERQVREQKEFEKRRDAHKADLQKLAAAGDRHASLAYMILDGQEGPLRVAGDVISEDLNARLKGSGIKLEKQFTETGVNHLRNHYEIQDEERGYRIGAATRTYYHDVDTKETRVVHDLLQMGAGVQGQGHGSKFLKASEDHYRDVGVKQAEVYANIDVGGYAWARLGFQWDKTSDMATVMDRFESSSHFMGPKANADYAAIKERAMKAYHEKIPHLMPTPFEFARIGYGENVPEQDMHAGKFLMLGAHWNGKKRYDVSRETTLSDGMVLTMFYSPGQKRDERGRWASGGGSAGGADTSAEGMAKAYPDAKIIPPSERYIGEPQSIVEVETGEAPYGVDHATPLSSDDYDPEELLGEEVPYGEEGVASADFRYITDEELRVSGVLQYAAEFGRSAKLSAYNQLTGEDPLKDVDTGELVKDLELMDRFSSDYLSMADESGELMTDGLLYDDAQAQQDVKFAGATLAQRLIDGEIEDLGTVYRGMRPETGAAEDWPIDTEDWFLTSASTKQDVAFNYGGIIMEIENAKGLKIPNVGRLVTHGEVLLHGDIEIISKTKIGPGLVNVKARMK